MRQWFRLDRPSGAAYLALLTACTHSMPPIMPPTATEVTAEQVASWVQETQPAHSALHRFKWLFRDERSSSGGRGSARIAIPDSLRFDVAGPLGAGKSAAMVVGDSAIWVEPEKSVQDLVPSYPLLWAMFGIAQLPADTAELTGLEAEDRIAWQYAYGADTLAYLRLFGSPNKLVAEVRHAGKVVGRAETSLSASGEPLKARLTVPAAPARLDITFYASVPTAEFPSSIWSRPQ